MFINRRITRLYISIVLVNIWNLYEKYSHCGSTHFKPLYISYTCIILPPPPLNTQTKKKTTKNKKNTNTLKPLLYFLLVVKYILPYDDYLIYMVYQRLFLLCSVCFNSIFVKEPGQQLPSYQKNLQILSYHRILPIYSQWII